MAKKSDFIPLKTQQKEIPNDIKMLGGSST